MRAPGGTLPTPGPTRRAPPESSDAIEPPPAPIEWTCTLGIRIGRSPIVSSVVDRGSKSLMIEMSVLVPPMSKPITFGRSSARASSTQATTPPTGPESASVTGRARAARGVSAPPFDCMTNSDACSAASWRLLSSPTRYSSIERHQRGVQRGRRRALVLAQFPRQLGRRADEPAVLATEDLGHLLLVLRIAVGMQEDDRDRLDSVRVERTRDPLGPRDVEGLDLADPGAHALAHLEAPLTRDERLGDLDERVVQLGPPMPPDLEHVAEALGRDQGRLGEPTLDDGVRGEGRTVQEEPHVVERHAELVGKCAQARDHARGRVGARRRYLQVPNSCIGPSDGDDVREGAADVDADDPGCAHDVRLSAVDGDS